MKTMRMMLVVLLVIMACAAGVDAANIARDAVGGDWSAAVDWQFDTVPASGDTAIHNASFGTLTYDTGVSGPNQLIDSFVGTGGGTPRSRLDFEASTILDVGTNFTLGITSNLKYIVTMPAVTGATLEVDGTIAGGDWNVDGSSSVTAGTIDPDRGDWTITGSVEALGDMVDTIPSPTTTSTITVESGGLLEVGGDTFASSITADVGGTITVADNVSALTKFTISGGSVTADTGGADPNGFGVAQFTIENDGTATFSTELRIPDGSVMQYGDINSVANTADVGDMNFAVTNSYIRPAGSTSAPSLTLEVSGDLSVATNSSTLEGQWDATGVDLVLDGNSAQDLEGISVDFGPDPNGVWIEHQLDMDPNSPPSCSEGNIYIRPWKSLRIASGATVTIVDNNVNGFRGSGDSKDAIYVDGDLTIESGATLNTGSFVIYYTGSYSNSGTVNGITPRHKVKRCYGDFDDDGDIDTSDFAIFAQAFAGSGQLPAYIVADADCDHDVDTSDFAIFSQNFTGPGGACPGAESSGGAGESAEDIADWCLSHLSEEACTSFAEKLAAVAEEMGETEEAAFYLDIAELLTAD